MDLGCWFVWSRAFVCGTHIHTSLTYTYVHRDGEASLGLWQAGNRAGHRAQVSAVKPELPQWRGSALHGAFRERTSCRGV